MPGGGWEGGRVGVQVRGMKGGRGGVQVRCMKKRLRETTKYPHCHSFSHTHLQPCFPIL